jgi:hypothetical protein
MPAVGQRRCKLQSLDLDVTASFLHLAGGVLFDL